MKKWLLAAFLLLLSALPMGAIAANTPADNTVYVAGNPDLFPFEYYDARSGRYQGILPELYKEISQTTGLEFVYIRPGMYNQQSRLAKNRQVELVSAYVQGQVDTAEQELVLLQLENGQRICIGFTAIMPRQTEARLRSCLEALTDHQLLELALRVPEPLPEQKLYLWSGIVCLLLLLTVAVLAAVLFRKRNRDRRSIRTRSVDPLTGIGNQSYFESAYGHCVTPASYALYYLCYIGLDIQQIDKYWGRPKSEEIQRFAADVLSQGAADGDFVARLGEGVYALGFQAPSEEEAGVRVGEFLNRLNGYDGNFPEQHRVWFRAGIFWISSANLPVETAVFNARQGYNTAVDTHCPYVFADSTLLHRESAKTELHQKLSGALEKHEFLLYLQMVVDRDGQIIGAESLARWQSPERGLLSPGVFIEPMKASGLVDKLDFYILEEACRQLAQWDGTEQGRLWISCNVTRMTVSRDDFLERFRNVLARHRFSPHRLVLELTEDSLMDNTTVAYRNILECKNLGCQIALDDLGSGHSSLQDLCDYPIDMIKIDRHILLKSSTSRGNALLQGLTKLGHGLGMKVLCEGVESETENQRVRDAGCDYIQGFYYAHPLPRDEADLFYLRKQSQ